MRIATLLFVFGFYHLAQGTCLWTSEGTCFWTVQGTEEEAISKCKNQNAKLANSQDETLKQKLCQNPNNCHICQKPKPAKGKPKLKMSIIIMIVIIGLIMLVSVSCSNFTRATPKKSTQDKKDEEKGPEEADWVFNQENMTKTANVQMLSKTFNQTGIKC